MSVIDRHRTRRGAGGLLVLVGVLLPACTDDDTADSTDTAVSTTAFATSSTPPASSTTDVVANDRIVQRHR